MILTYDAIRNAKDLMVRLADALPEMPLDPKNATSDEKEIRIVRQALFDFIQSADETRLELERLQRYACEAGRCLVDRAGGG